MKQLRNTFKQLLPFLAVCAFFLGAPSKAMADDKAYVVWCEGNKTLYFGFGEVPSRSDLYNGQEVTSVWSGDAVTASGKKNPSWKDIVARNLWNSPLEHVIIEWSFSNVLPSSTAHWFDCACNLVDIIGLEYLNTSGVQNMTSMFEQCSELKSLNLSSFDTKNVFTMTRMFYNCYNLEQLTFGDKFDTSNVTDMNSMFEGTGFKSLDLTGFSTKGVLEMKAMFKSCENLSSIKFGEDFNTENVTTMDEMFASTTRLKTVDLSSLDTRNVTSMYKMFYQSGVNTIQFGGNFDTSKVKTFSSMFQGSSISSLDLSGFTCTEATCNDMFLSCGALVTLIVGNMDVKNTGSMFKDCKGLTTLDLSKMSTINTTWMNSMFSGCSNLKTIYVGTNWSTENVENSEKMFNSCSNIIGGKGTTYDTNHTDAEYAHIDGGPDNPGYFTEKASIISGDANGDGLVNVTDIVATVNFIMEKPSDGFNKEAADLNGDGVVNVTDIVMMVSIIMDGGNQ